MCFADRRLDDDEFMLNETEINQIVKDQASPGVFLLVGLGNPGREYRESRHNVGFMAVDELSKEFSIPLSRVQSKALVGTGVCGLNRIVLAKPQTYMNLSGESVRGLVRFYKVPLTNLLVIHDDLDLPFGTMRMRPVGSSGGQRGLASIIQQLGTQDFPRLRIGIGRPPGQMDPADYVLQSFSKAESTTVTVLMKRASEAIRAFLENGIESAMNRFNGQGLEE